MKSLLRIDGLSYADYQKYFNTFAEDDFPELAELVDHQLAENSSEKMTLTDAGFERSDTIGPWLFSTEMVTKMESYELV